MVSKKMDEILMWLLEVLAAAPWKFIMQGFNDFSCKLKFVVGNGARIRFWEDCWIDPTPLCLRFPRLYRLCFSQSALIQNRWERSSQYSGWGFDFRRNLNDREIEELSSLLSLLDDVSLNMGGEDRRAWSMDSKGIFSCKSFFEWLVNDESHPLFEHANVVWKSKVPNKIKFLGWLIAHGKVNTCDIIQKRYPNLCLLPSWCVMCQNSEENLNHLFLHCLVAK
jgi:hypothetical protein